MPLNATDLAALSRLLDQAMELEGAEREAWIAGLSDEDEHLAPMLSEMLAERDSARTSGFLSSMPALGDSGPKDEETAAAGDLVGPYRLIRQIGRGGMGTVWLAERADGTFKRQVALKLPRLAWGAGLAERMAREREIGALLEHPNIARLYDAGVDERGRPYLALEYIDGVQIDAWCRDQALSARDRLKLIVQVARAVSYAHGRLVVHRDLKPSNVLVTADGQTHLLDFGIAKLINEASPDERGLTQEQGRVLTPHFASPEQLSGGAITVQSDVYSLGVLTYELLTGKTPYQPTRKTLAALEEAVLEGEPALASSRAVSNTSRRALKGEVDAILAMALRREPAKRYATADALASDIERHLAGDRVLARPDSTLYRWRKQFRRHRVAAAVSTALVVALVGGAASLFQARRADSEAERARVVKEFVVEVFKVNSRGQDNESRRKLPAAMLIEHGAELIDTKFNGQPRLQAELFGVVGGIFAEMGASEAAAQYASREIRALAESDANASDQARAVLMLSSALRGSRHFVQALAEAERAATLARGDAELLGQSIVSAAETQFDLGRYREAGETLNRFEHLQGRGSAAPSATHARALSVRATVRARANPADATVMPLFRAAIDEALAAEGPRSPVAVDIRLTVAKHLLQFNGHAEAREFGSLAVASLRSSGAASEIRADLVEARLARGTYRVELMSFAEASAILERVRSDVTSHDIAVPEAILASIDFDHGATLLLWGDNGAADPLLASSIAVLRRSSESDSERGGFAIYQGHAALVAGRYAEAEHFFRERVDSMQFEKHGRNPSVVYSEIYLALSLDAQGRFEEAANRLLSLPDFGPAPADNDADDPDTEIRSALARIKLDSGDARSALQTMAPPARDRSGEIYFFSDQVQLRGEILCALGEHKAGLALMSRAIDHDARRDRYPYKLKLARARAVAGICALDDGQRERAVELARAARFAFSQQPDPGTFFHAPMERLEKRLATVQQPAAR